MEKTVKKIEELIDNALTQFCYDNPETGIAKTAQTVDGFEDVALRIKQVLIKDFKDRQIRLDEVIWWLNQNEYEEV
jgi:hypothetical protein